MEAQAKGIIKFVHINGNDNPPYILTNSHTSSTWFPLIDPLIFWLDMDFLKEWVVSEGSENRSSTPLYLKIKALHSSPSSLILGIF